LNTSDTTRDRAIVSYYRTSIGRRMRSIECWYFQWLWRTRTRFSRSRQKQRDKVTKEH